MEDFEEVNVDNNIDMEVVSDATELFNEVMMGIFLRGPAFERSLELLSTGTIDITHHDNQLFRELEVGRLGTIDTLRVYNVLVNKYNYVMVVRDIESIIRHYY